MSLHRVSETRRRLFTQHEEHLTSQTERWDPVSKQPIFKGGAIRITRCSDQDAIRTKQQQTAAEQHVEHSKPDAHEVQDDSPRERHLELWLGATEESIILFIKICKQLIPKLIHDLEVVGGIQILQGIAQRAQEMLHPFVEKYGADSKYGRAISESLSKTIFPWHEQKKLSAYGTLATLQGLLLYLANTRGHLTALLLYVRRYGTKISSRRAQKPRKT